MEAGETPEAAAARELHEELGVEIVPDHLLPVGFASGPGSVVPGKPGGRAIVILLYACKAWEGEPKAHEAEALDWYLPEAIPGLAMPPLDYPLADALSTFLREKAI